MKNRFEVPAELLTSPMHEFGSWAQTFLVDVSWYIHRKLMFTERELQHKGIIFSHGERQNADPCEGTRLCHFEGRSLPEWKKLLFLVMHGLITKTVQNITTHTTSMYTFLITPTTNELTKPLPSNCTTCTQEKHWLAKQKWSLSLTLLSRPIRAVF